MRHKAVWISFSAIDLYTEKSYETQKGWLWPPLLSLSKRESTAAAADEDQSDDEDPDPVVIEYVAQTVVHGIPPKI